MKKLLQQLASLGFKAIQVTLQNIEHKNGSNWAYSNRQSGTKGTIFGVKDDTVTFSIVDPNKQQQSERELWVTIWLNSCDAEEAKIYASDFGKDAVCIIHADGSPELMSVEQCKTSLLPTDVSTSPDAPSQQA